MHRQHIGIGKRESDRLRAAQRWICRLELDRLDDLLVGFELHEAAVERVGARGRFADPGRRIGGERKPKRAAFASVKRMHVAGHAGRHHPSRDRNR
jgi:hypothetical protein